MPQHPITTTSQRSANPCATCVIGCCHRHTVNVGGYDIWLIARGLELDPSQFAQPAALRAFDKPGFLLRPGGPRYELTLAKRPTGAEHEPCLFLVELPDGTGRCGIYPLRPLICRSYPATARGGMVIRRTDVLCPDGAWPDAALSTPEWYEQVARHNVEADIYSLVLSRWNYRVLYSRLENAYTFADFLVFLVQIYDQLEQARAALPPGQWRELCLRWEGCLDRLVSPLLHDCEELRPWAATVAAIRGAVGSFFAEDLHAHLADEMAAWEAERASGAAHA